MSNLPSAAVFTLRDLNRQPAKVLAAVRKFGFVEIRTRSGEVYTVSAKLKAIEGRSAKRFPDFSKRWTRLRETGNVPPTSAQYELINRVIAGEE